MAPAAEQELFRRARKAMVLLIHPDKYKGGDADAREMYTLAFKYFNGLFQDVFGM